MSISKKDVEHIAMLARLHLDEEEKEVYAKELSQILEHAAKISGLDTKDVSPTSHAIPIRNVMREDVITSSIPRDDALLNAPDKENDAFVVPKIV
ncbi:MAG: Asp-tRNA(Asn)/Glu-tRNA(Gln) amidotransferase subunit GatC [Actinobacteria bacterium]|nr:Asp-tRNA(Asn)/Glu-tRNA(Gln) amidotransferase subunit GatC [Actinomycetota bacterium]